LAFQPLFPNTFLEKIGLTLIVILAKIVAFGQNANSLVKKIEFKLIVIIAVDFLVASTTIGTCKLVTLSKI
jgi:hypothetical protein